MSAVAARMAFFMVLLPGAIGLASVALGWWLSKGGGTGARMRLARAIPGFGGAVALSIAGWQIQGLPAKMPLVAEWPPFATLAGKEWSLILIALAGVLSLGEAFDRRTLRATARWLGRFSLALGMIGLLLGRAFETQFDGGQAWLWRFLLGGGLLAWWWGSDRLARRATGPSLPILFQVVASSVAGLMFFAGAVGQSNMAGAVAAVCGGAMVAGFVFRSASLAPGLITVIGTGLWSMFFVGFFYGGDEGAIPLLAAGLLALSVVAGFAGDLPVLRKRRAWKRMLVRLVLVGALGGGVVGLTAWHASQGAEDDEYGYY